MGSTRETPASGDDGPTVFVVDDDQVVARGMLNKQIAAELGTSEATVQQHRARAMEKLGVGSVAELAAMLERLRADRLPGGA